MSQVTGIKKRMALPALIFAAAVLFIVSGCGSSTSNSSSVFNSDSGSHPADWLPAGHMMAAQADITVCAECHGEDYSGGIANVSCTKCHLGGPASKHPQAWGQDVAANHGPYVVANGNGACSNAVCHGTTLSGVANSGPSCTSCHLGGVSSFHPSTWGQDVVTKHGAYVDANGNTSCATAACHGATLSGGEAGPSCTSCHIGGVGSFHPADWGAYTYSAHASYVKTNGNTSCSNAACHGTDLTGANGPSCTSCHLGGVGSIHPADWSTNILNHADYVASNGAGACANAVCHGTQLQGVVGSGPSCNTCH